MEFTGKFESVAACRRLNTDCKNSASEVQPRGNVNKLDGKSVPPLHAKFFPDRDAFKIKISNVVCSVKA